MAVFGSMVAVEPPVGLLEAGASPDQVATMYLEYYRAATYAACARSSGFGTNGGVEGRSLAGALEQVCEGEEERHPVSPGSSVSHVVPAGRRGEVVARESVTVDVQRKLDVALQSHGEGFCYLAAVTWAQFGDVAARFGPNPRFRDLVGEGAGSFEDDAYLASLHVDVSGDVAHVVAGRAGGTTFLTLCRSFEVGEFSPQTLVGRTASLARCDTGSFRDKNFKVGACTFVDLELSFDRPVAAGIAEIGYVLKRAEAGTEFAFVAPPLRRVGAERFWQRPVSVSRVTVNGELCNDKCVRLCAGVKVVVSAMHEMGDLGLSLVEVGGSVGGDAMNFLLQVDLFSVVGALVSPNGLGQVADYVRRSSVAEGSGGKWCSVVVRTATSMLSCGFALAAVDSAALLSAVDAESGFRWFDANSVVRSSGGQLESLDLVVGGARCHVVLVDVAGTLTPPVVESGSVPSGVKVARFAVGAPFPVFVVEGADWAADGRVVQSVLNTGKELAVDVNISRGEWSNVRRNFFPSILDGRTSRVTFKRVEFPIGFSLVWWKR